MLMLSFLNSIYHTATDKEQSDDSVFDCHSWF